MREFAKVAFLTTLMGIALAQTGNRDPWIVYQATPPLPSEQSPNGPTPPQSPFPAPNPPSPTFPSLTPSPSEKSQAPTSPYPPGKILKGYLLTGVYLVPGKTVPVAVSLEDGTVLVGQANFEVTGRVWIDLSTAVLKNGQTLPVRAVALEASEATHGIPAKVGEEAPNLLADLVRGSLGGISDFVKASLEATNVATLPGGGQVVQKSTPPLELFLLSRAANLIALPEGDKAVIRTVKVERDTPLLVLFLPGGGPEPQQETQPSTNR